MGEWEKVRMGEWEKVRKGEGETRNTKHEMWNGKKRGLRTKGLRDEGTNLQLATYNILIVAIS